MHNHILNITVHLDIYIIGDFKINMSFSAVNNWNYYRPIWDNVYVAEWYNLIKQITEDLETNQTDFYIEEREHTAEYDNYQEDEDDNDERDPYKNTINLISVKYIDSKLLIKTEKSNLIININDNNRDLILTQLNIIYDNICNYYIIEYQYFINRITSQREKKSIPIKMFEQHVSDLWDSYHNKADTNLYSIYRYGKILYFKITNRQLQKAFLKRFEPIIKQYLDVITNKNNYILTDNPINFKKNHHN